MTPLVLATLLFPEPTLGALGIHKTALQAGAGEELTTIEITGMT